MKIGRNDPCPCGSGKKWKKCCGGKGIFDKYGNFIPPPEVLEAAKRFYDIPREPFEQNGFLTGRPFIDHDFNGHRFRAVGNTVYKRPLNETFHEFVLDIFAEGLGYDWVRLEQAQPDDKQNPIGKWYREIAWKLQEKIDPGLPAGHVHSIKQSGNTRALLAMAYDYYSLCHCQARIQPKFISRLKNRDNFQGARYEMAVAGIAVRAGFDITWVNDKSKHCEFIGTHKITKDTVQFEAKSHHREGVLGRPGSSPFNAETARIKILDHINQALEQSDKSMPLIIFDDLNLPITPGIDYKEKRWFKEVDDSLKTSGFLEGYKSTNYGALFVTNFSWHFHDDLSPLKENEVLLMWHIGGKYSLDPRAIRFLEIASKQYGFVPPKLEENRAEPQVPAAV